ncbi:transposase, partial [Candidatus Cetobacterium colombiensis]
MKSEKPEVKLTDESVGIDLGVRDLATCSTGKIYKNINKTKRVKKFKKKLKRLQK